MSRDTLGASGVTHLFRSGGFDIDGTHRRRQQFGKHTAHGIDVLSKTRRLSNHCAIEIAQLQVLSLHRLHHLGQQLTAVDPLVLWVSVGKVTTDIALADRSKQSIADGMNQNIAIRMREHCLRVRDLDPTDDHMIALAKTVGVETMTYAHCVIRCKKLRDDSNIAVMELFDTHCHLDLAAFDNDRSAVLASAREHGVRHFLVPATQRSGWGKLWQLCEQHKDCYPAIGLHPMLLPAHSPSDLTALAEFLEQHRPVAIGEIGLDFHDKTLDKNQQLQFFEAQLELAEHHQLPVVLHVRKAHDPVLTALKRFRLPGGTCHAFNGSLAQAERYIAMNFKLGFGGMLTYPNANKLHALAKTLSLANLVLETDAPDMSGYAHRYQRNLPAYLPEALDALAKLKDVAPETIAKSTTQNALSVFGLAEKGRMRESVNA